MSSLAVDQLVQLRLAEKKLVDSIRQEVKAQEPEALVAYLPNLLPAEPVDFIVIAMEPSLAWARTEAEAAQKVQAGYRNFMHSWEDFILHYCLKNYLGSHYVTDVSKAAMSVSNGALWRSRLYPRWLELLKQEIALVAKPQA
ncbi:MAG: hypothetical protein CVV27_03775, partial [Candidatus Melainabacteria bacterium HGW-Melainabacteria-1]